MNPVRILHMIGSMNIGGSQTMILNLYRAIDREKVQFDFVLDHHEERALASQFEALGARIYSVPTFTGKNINQVLQAWNTFFEEHPEYKILHSHVRSYASLYLPIARKHGLKTIIHSHSTSNGSGIKALVKKTLQYPLRYLADYYFSCSEEAGRWLFGSKTVTSEKHYVVRNAIDARAYRYDPLVREQYIAQLGLTGKYVYAHVGRFHPAKNHEFLLRVFKKISEKNPDAHLMLVGDGDLRSEIETQIAQLALTDRVLLLGNRHDISGVLQAADCFLFPSKWEGLGIVAVEAQAAGLPCICSDQVPRLVHVMPSCQFLALEEELWVQAALQASRERTDAYEQIVGAGYDVFTTAEWLYAFYQELWTEV